MNKKARIPVAELGPELASRLSGGSAGASVDMVVTLPPLQRAIARTAFYESLRIMWIVYLIFAALGLFVSLFIRNHVL
jgi:hypothetical protein